MKQKKPGKLLSLLLALVMVVGMLPSTAVFAATGSGDSASDPVVVSDFAEFKAAMEDSDIQYVKLTGSKTEELPANTSLEAAITVAGTKYLKIEGNTIFDSNDGYGYDCILLVKGASNLYVSGSGTLQFSPKLNGASNAVIRQDGGNVSVTGNVTLKSQSLHFATYGYAINHNYGRLDIAGGTLIGSQGGIDESELSSAVLVTCGDSSNVTISGGKFEVVLFNGFSTKQPGLSIHDVHSSKGVKLSGGTFINGIRTSKITTYQDYLAEGCEVTEEADGTITLGNSATTPEKISTVSVAVNAPVAGATAPKDVVATVPSDANYTAKLIFWIDKASGNSVDKFEAGHSYYARVEVAPKPGYELAAKPDVTINGKKATSSTLGCFDSSVFDVNAEEIEITHANVTLENFKVGNKISDVILTCEHPEQYVASNLCVRTGIGETPLADNAVLENQTYLVEVEITPKTGYFISSSTNSHITNGEGFEGGTNPSMPWKYVTPEKDTPSHTHTGTLVTGQAATCTADGWKDYYKCDCGKFFEDAACTNEISDLNAWKTGKGKLAKLEHTLGEWQHDDTDHWKKCSVCGTVAEQAAHTFGEWTIVTPATETADGLRKHTCSVCGHEVTEVIPAEGHTHTATLVTGQAATCTADGWKDYYKCDCGKFFEDAACTNEISDLNAWKTGEGKLAKLEHTLGEWQHDDTNHWKKCSVCGTDVEKAAHTFGEWTIVTPATETADGLRKHTCSVCGHEVTEVIPAEGHTHTATLVTGQAATCTADGWKDYYKCDCGKFFEDAACTNEISDLNAWKTGKGKLAKLEHTLGEWQHDDANHWKKCSVCGTDVEKAAHTFGEWTIVTPATETADGLRKHTCSVCGHEATEVIPATGHTHVGTLVAGKAPTHADDGWKDYYKCSCGKFFEDAACTKEIPNLAAWQNGAGKLDKLVYIVIEGNNSSWQKNTDGTITFRVNGDFAEFTGIKVDGTLVASKHYTAKSGSTIVTLKKAYLQSLSEGSHTITFLYTDGQCEANFKVTAAETHTEPTAPESTDPTNPTKPNPPTGVDTPQTGDESNIMLWLIMSIASAFGLVAVVLYRRKRNAVK